MVNMLHRQNRPPYDPKIPGTDLRSKNVPTARIYRPSKSATQSAPRRTEWILEFEPYQAKKIEPLMGWTESSDPYQPIRLRFPDRDSAVAFAEHNDWTYVVRDDHSRRGLNPWSGHGHEAHRLYKGVDVPGMRRLALPGQSRSDHRLAPGEAADAFDPVHEADLESFPASDPSSWTGTTIASRKADE